MHKGSHTRPKKLARPLRAQPLSPTPELWGIGAPIPEAAWGRGADGPSRGGRSPSVNTTRPVPRPTPRTPARPIVSAGDSAEAHSPVASYFSMLSVRSQVEWGDTGRFYGHKRRLAQAPRITVRWQAGKDDTRPPFHRQRWTCPRKTIIVRAGSLNLGGGCVRSWWAPRRTARGTGEWPAGDSGAGQGCSGWSAELTRGGVSRHAGRWAAGWVRVSAGLGAATLLCGVGGREVVDWPVALLPRWGTRYSRWVSQFLRWVRSSPLAPCPGLSPSLGVRRDDPPRRAQPQGPLLQPRSAGQGGTSRSPRDMGARALRGGCPGSPSLGLTGSFPSLLLPRTPSSRACPWKRCLFWSASAKLLPLLTVKNMGPRAETGSETDGGRGGAPGSRRCRSPAGEGSGQGVPGLPSGAAGPRPITDLSGRRALLGALGRISLSPIQIFKLSWREVSLQREELWN